MKLNLSLILLLFLSAQPSRAQNISANSWAKLGEVIAAPNLDNESILLIESGAYKSIKLKISDVAIKISGIELYFEGANNEEIIMDKDIQAGQETEAMAVRSSDKKIRKIVFYYKLLPNDQKGKAKVELYGSK